MAYKPSDNYYIEFCTQNFSTGSAANADSTPTATANKNGTDDAGFVLTVANIDTGRYKVTGVVPSGYVAGDTVNVTVAATVSTVAGKDLIDSFVVDSKRIGDLQDLALTTLVQAVWDKATSALSSAGSIGKLLVDNINATVSSRSTQSQITGGSYALNTDASGNVKLSCGTGANQLSLASGAVTVGTLPAVPSDFASSANQTTILNRLGAFTGSGLNTIFGFFKALLRKDAALTPSDVGGTYDNTTMSLEAMDGTLVTAAATVASKLDVAVSSRLAASGYTAPDNTDIVAIKAKTDNLPSDPASNTYVLTRLATSGYTAPDNGDIATILSMTDVPTSSRLASLAYTAPDNATISTLLTDINTLLTRADVPTSSRLAAADYVAPDNADITAILARLLTTSGTTLTAGDISSVAGAVAAVVIEDSETLTTVLRYLLAMATGKIGGVNPGASAIITIRDKADTKDRITLHVDEYGNRSSVTLDGS